MATTLVSTGIQFPDGTTQTTAATAGATVSTATTTFYHNGVTTTQLTFTGVAGYPYVAVNLRRNNIFYSHEPVSNAEVGNPVNTDYGRTSNPSAPGVNSYDVRYNFTNAYRPHGYPTQGPAAWRVSYRYVS